VTPTDDKRGATARARRAARRLMDKLAEPYVEQSIKGVVDSLAAPPAAPLASTEPVPAVELHAALHEARSIALAEMPAGAETVLSAGANGAWYFEWFDREYGSVRRHIGVEAYMPRPERLPPNVEWVEADLAGPDGVAAVDTGSVDLVFSGQNIEHLWPAQMVAFLVESNRVLRAGGYLVVDSPNRELAAMYRWSMGEHTVELTPNEAHGLFALAGFAVDHMKGVWLCRTRGRLLDLEPPPSLLHPDGYTHRIALATQRPADSFIWWAEARKVSDPDVQGLRGAVTALFDAAWPERVGRIKPEAGEPITLGDGRPGVVMPKGTHGISMIGPYMAVPPGTYDFSVDVAWKGYDDRDHPVAFLELLAGDEMLATTELQGVASTGSQTLSCTARFSELRFTVHIRLVSTGVAEVASPLSMSMAPDAWRHGGAPAPTT
jgi:SAM-dependent methyltransferase